MTRTRASALTAGDLLAAAAIVETRANQTGAPHLHRLADRLTAALPEREQQHVPEPLQADETGTLGAQLKAAPAGNGSLTAKTVEES